MKIFHFAVLLIITIFSKNSSAALTDGLIFKPALTLEYQVPKLDSNNNAQFKNRLIEQQLKNFDNLVLGLNLRLYKYWGLNANWSKFTLENKLMVNYQSPTILNLKMGNFSSVFYFPVINDGLIETFAEIGIADINSKLNFTNNSTDNNIKNHEITPFYGAGIAINPYDLDLIFRIGIQFYNTKLGNLQNNLIIWRFGVVKYF